MEENKLLTNIIFHKITKHRKTWKKLQKKGNNLLNPVDPVPPKLNPVDLLAEVLPNSPVLVFEPNPPIEGNDEEPNVLPKPVPKVLPVLPNTDVAGLF